MRHKLLAAGAIGATLLLLQTPPEGLSMAGWRTAILMALMAFYWFSESLPVTVTALLPMVLLPLWGVAEAPKVAASYTAPVIFLLLGGAFLALAMERWGLHRRLALLFVRRSGTCARTMILCVMGVTTLISMLISNTATALIMMPIVLVVLNVVAPEGETLSEDQRGFAIVMVLAVAYASTLGGFGTLIGSPTNAIAVALAEKMLGIKISFLDWMAFGLPVVALGVPAFWLCLTRLAYPRCAPPIDSERVLAAIGDAGPMSTGERRVIPVVALAIAGWLALPWLQEIPGLGAMDDAMVALIAGLLFFVIPAGDGGALLRWSDTKRAPWDVFMLFGGGLALATQVSATGLGDWIGSGLSGLGAAPLLLAMLAVIGVVMLATEFASNVATAAGFMPVVAGLVATTDFPPLWLIMPAALAASWGFMLPAGTGSNAIAYATGRVSARHMIRAGFIIDLLGFAIIPLAVWLGMQTMG